MQINRETFWQSDKYFLSEQRTDYSKFRRFAREEHAPARCGLHRWRQEACKDRLAWYFRLIEIPRHVSGQAYVSWHDRSVSSKKCQDIHTCSAVEGRANLPSLQLRLQGDVGICFGERSGGRVYVSSHCGEVASEPGDRLQVTHVATEATVTRGDESPISVLL